MTTRLVRTNSGRLARVLCEAEDESETIGRLEYQTGEISMRRRKSYYQRKGDEFKNRLDMFCSKLTQPRDTDRFLTLAPHLFSLEQLIQTVDHCLYWWLESDTVAAIIKSLLALEPYTYYRCFQQNAFHNFDPDWVFLRSKGRSLVIKRLPSTAERSRVMEPGWFQANEPVEMKGKKDPMARTLDVLEPRSFFHCRATSAMWLEVDIPHKGYIYLAAGVNVTPNMEIDQAYSSKTDRAIYGLVSAKFVKEQQVKKNRNKKNRTGVKTHYFGLDNGGGRRQNKKVVLHRNLWPLIVCLNQEITSDPEQGLGWYQVLACTAIRATVDTSGRRVGVLYPGQKVLVVENLGRRARISQPVQGFVSYESQQKVQILRPYKKKRKHGNEYLITHFLRHFENKGGLGWFRLCLNCVCRAGIDLRSPRVKILGMGLKVYVEEDHGERCRISDPVEGWVSWHNQAGDQILMRDSDDIGSEMQFSMPSLEETQELVRRLSQTDRLTLKKARRLSSKSNVRSSQRMSASDLGASFDSRFRESIRDSLRKVEAAAVLHTKDASSGDDSSFGSSSSSDEDS